MVHLRGSRTGVGSRRRECKESLWQAGNDLELCTSYKGVFRCENSSSCRAMIMNTFSEVYHTSIKFVKKYYPYLHFNNILNKDYPIVNESS